MDITIDELKERMDKGEALHLFDVREEYEFDEIAEMLSGKDISDSALNHAKALLN